MRNRRINRAIRASLLYGAIAAVWILVSDQVLDAIVGVSRSVGLQTYKGWAFVAITTVLFYAVLRRELRRLEQETAARTRAETALRESQARLAGIVGSAMDAIISVDATQRIVVFNAAAEQMFGCAATAAVGQPLDRFIPPQLRAAHAAHIQAFGQTGVTSRSMHAPGQLVALRADGAEFPIEATISQVIAQEQPLYTVIMRDITTRRRAEQALQRAAERLRVLADASKAFAEMGAAYEALLDQIVETVTTVLGAGCMLNLRAEDGHWLHMVAFGDVDATARDLQRSLLDADLMLLDDQWLQTHDVQTLSPLLVPVVDIEALRGNALPAYVTLAERIGVHSLIRIPLRVHGQVLGVLVLHRHRPAQPAFDEDDLRLAQDLADRAALAIGNARLYVALQQSHATLETRVAERTAELATSNATLADEIAGRTRLDQQLQRQARHASALAALSHRLAEAGRELQPLFDMLVRHVTELTSDTCVLSVVSTDRQWMQPVASRDPDPARDRVLRTLLAGVPERTTAGWSAAVLASGQALRLAEIPIAEVRAQLDPRYHPLLATVDAISVVVIPVRAHDTVLGTLTVIRTRTGQPFTADDEAFFQDLADRAGLAIENARLFASEQAARDEAERAN